MTRRGGLTLLELVVVLAILAVLATVAVALTESTVDQARFDATQRTWDGIQTAVLGPAKQFDSNGDRVMAGFVADTGLLPNPTVAPGDPLDELAHPDQPARLRPFGLVTASDSTGDTNPVRLLAGWRGPYLRVPQTFDAINNRFRAVVQDGWGNPPALTLDATTGAVVGAQTADGPAPPYNVPRVATFPDAAWKATNVVVTVENTNASSAPISPNVAVRATVADARITGPGYRFVDSAPVTLASGTTTVVLTGTATAPIPIGVVAVRAYHWDSTNNQIDLTTRSNLRYLRVPPTGLVDTVSLKINLPNS